MSRRLQRLIRLVPQSSRPGQTQACTFFLLLPRAIRLDACKCGIVRSAATASFAISCYYSMLPPNGLLPIIAPVALP